MIKSAEFLRSRWNGGFTFCHSMSTFLCGCEGGLSFKGKSVYGVSSSSSSSSSNAPDRTGTNNPPTSRRISQVPNSGAPFPSTVAYLRDAFNQVIDVGVYLPLEMRRFASVMEHARNRLPPENFAVTLVIGENDYPYVALPVVHPATQSGQPQQQYEYVPLVPQDQTRQMVLNWKKEAAEEDIAYAAKENRVADLTEHIRTGLDLGVDLNARITIGDETHTAIGWAAYQGNTEAVKLLMESNADPSLANLIGATPLHLSCRHGHSDVTKLLLEDARVKVNAQFNGLTPLHFACGKSGCIENVQLLYAYAATVDVVSPQGATALVMATQHQHTNIVQFLVEKGANPSPAWRSPQQPIQTPLSDAVARGNIDIVRLLVEEAGVDPATMPDGTSLIRRAIYFGWSQITELLVNAEKSRLSMETRSEAEKAAPLHEMVRTILPNADPAIWQDIEQQYLVGSQCLSRLLARILATEEYQKAPPGQQAEYRANVAITLQEIQKNWPAERELFTEPGFVDYMMGLSKKALVDNDAVLFNPLAKMFFEMRRFNLMLINPFDQGYLRQSHENKTGTMLLRYICFRPAIKWLGCILVRDNRLHENFKYSKMNFSKASTKHDAYHQAFEAARDRELLEAEKAYSEACDHARNQGLPEPSPEPFKARIIAAMKAVESATIKQWLDDFTSGNGTRHVHAITTHARQTIDPHTYFSQHSLDGTQGCVIVFNMKASDGSSTGVHTIAVCGGRRPMIFDPDLGEYVYTGNNFPHDLQAYLELAYKPSGGQLDYDVTPVSKAGIANTEN